MNEWTDHHLSKQPLSLTNLENYSLGSSYSHILNQGGSVCFYIRTDIEYTTLVVSQNCIEKYIELWVAQINSKYCHIVIICIYRSPTGKYSQFLSFLDATLKHLHTPNTKFLICGDVNVDYLLDSHRKTQLIALLHTYNLPHTTSLFTTIFNCRVSYIDNIFIDIIDIRRPCV
jgi:exonuclease III